MPRPATTALLAAAALVVAACGPAATTTTTEATTTSEPSASTTSTDATTTTTTQATTSTPATTTTVAAVGDFRTGTYASDGFPGSGSPALLETITIEAHAGFDRVVFAFGGAADDLTYEIDSVAEPILESPSGREVDVAGESFLAITMTPASGFEFVDGEVVPTYTGDERVAPPGDASAVAEVVRTEDFENVMTWVIGVTGDGARAHRLDRDAGRLVIDVRSPEVLP